MITLNKKNEFRKMALKTREKLVVSGSNSIKSSNIVSKILNSKEFQIAKNIALYYPIRNEIDITSLLKIKDKKFYLPVCRNNELYFVCYCGEENLKNGSFGIKEPIGECINPSLLDIVYTPALMANRKNYRLGYGKGFYDRFFKNNQVKALKIIVLANELISDDFVQDDFDYRCDGIISA